MENCQVHLKDKTSDRCLVLLQSVLEDSSCVNPRQQKPLFQISSLFPYLNPAEERRVRRRSGKNAFDKRKSVTTDLVGRQCPGISISRALACLPPTSGIHDAGKIRIYRGWSGVLLIWGIPGYQALVRGDTPGYLQATLRCEPRRTSAPGTCSLRIAAALIASAFGRVS